MDIKISLDNITITAYVNSNKLRLLKNLVENHVAITVTTAMTDLFYAYTKVEDRVILKIDYDKRKGQAFHARPFRMEFNPNKLRIVDKQILKIIIPCLEDISISRVDLAIDLFEVDCSNFILEKKGRATATKEFRSSTGKLETKYLGASRSEKQIRLYNKKAEQLAKGNLAEKEFASQFDNWWRLEFQLRNRSVEEIFDIINTIIFKPFNFEDLPTETQIYLVAYTHNKNVWNKLHRNTRTKYKKLLENYKTSEIDYLGFIKKSLNHERRRLEKELAYFSGRTL